MFGSAMPSSRARSSAPALEPAPREILDRIADQGRATLVVEEEQFRQRQAAPQHDLLDLSRPAGFRRLAEFGIEPDVPSLLLEARRRINACRRIGFDPIGKEEMVQGVGLDQMRHTAQRVHLGAQSRIQPNRRPHEQFTIRQPYHGHACGIGKAVEGTDRPVGHPKLFAEGSEPCRDRFAVNTHHLEPVSCFKPSSIRLLAIDANYFADSMRRPPRPNWRLSRQSFQAGDAAGQYCRLP